MLGRKDTNFLSEISKFFKNNDSDRAMFTLMNVIKGIKMNERTLFGRTSRCNCVYSLLQVFQLLFICSSRNKPNSGQKS